MASHPWKPLGNQHHGNPYTLRAWSPLLSPEQSSFSPEISVYLDFLSVDSLFFFNNFNVFIYLFLAMLGLCCCPGFSLVVASRGHSLVEVCGLLIVVTSLVAKRGLQSTGSVVVAHRLSCFVARGIFPGQGWNLCLLHWQADSYH